MKIHYVTTRYPPHTGGVESHVAELATRMVDRGHDVTVQTADRGDVVDSESLTASELREGVQVRRHRGIAPGGAFHVAPGVVSAVRTCDADVVHAHNYHSFPLFFAALGLSLRGSDVPLVATPHYHAGSASSVRDRLLSAYRPLGGWALRRADRVIAVSEWERNRLDTDFGVDAQVVPNGLDLERFENATPVERDRPYLLTVGRLEEYKGVQHVIRALTDLPEYDLVVAGDGAYADDLRRVARETGVSGQVDFRGYVPDEELPGLYAEAAAYVTMSGFEAYGMTVAEALASGTPSVVRRAGALVDWAERSDCVGVELGEVVAGIREAAGLSAPSDPLASWDEVATRVSEVYHEATQ